jgi:hypothetical protein
MKEFLYHCWPLELAELFMRLRETPHSLVFRNNSMETFVQKASGVRNAVGAVQLSYWCSLSAHNREFFTTHVL